MIHKVSGLQPLMAMWGGEGISFSRRYKELAPLLRRLGNPSIVVAAVSIRPTWLGQFCGPDLAKIFVGATRGLETTGEIHHESSIPPDGILDIWQPGNAEYERYSELPRD